MFWVPQWPTGKREIAKLRLRFFYTGTQPRRTYGGMSFHWLLRWRIASRRTLSGSANRANPTSSIVLPIMCGTSMRSLDQAGISSAFVIAQDWGTALAFHLAARRPEFIRALAFMEFIRPLPTWDDFLPGAQSRPSKSSGQPGVGEKMILEGNVFVEAVLPGATARKLTDEEMSVYRAPFPTPESRRPTWRFPNEIPIAGEPADVYLTLEKAHEALAESTYPKLLFAGNPGAIVSPAFAENFAKGLKNCRLVQLSSGLHYLQEDHPDVIGANVKEWLIELGVAFQLEAEADIVGISSDVTSVCIFPVARTIGMAWFLR